MGVALVALHPSVVPLARPLSQELPDVRFDSTYDTSGRNRCPSASADTFEPLWLSAEIESSLVAMASSSSSSSASSSSFSCGSRGHRRNASSS